MFSRFTLLRVSFLRLLLSFKPEVVDAHLLDEAVNCGPTFRQLLSPVLYWQLFVFENALHTVKPGRRELGYVRRS